MPTLFERIISGELPADIVYRDERVIAFRDGRIVGDAPASKDNGVHA